MWGYLNWYKAKDKAIKLEEKKNHSIWQPWYDVPSVISFSHSLLSGALIH